MEHVQENKNQQELLCQGAEKIEQLECWRMLPQYKMHLISVLAGDKPVTWMYFELDSNNVENFSRQVLKQFTNEINRFEVLLHGK